MIGIIMKRNGKIAIGLCILLLVISAVLSGCINSVTTVGWKNSSEDYCAILKGAAPKEYNNGYPLVKVKFVYDDESHEKWQDYRFTIENEKIINRKSINNVLYFEGVTSKLYLYGTYYFRAVALYAVTDGTQEDIWFAGEEISFSLMQTNNEESVIE